MSYRQQLVAAISILQQANRDMNMCMPFMPHPVRGKRVNLLSSLLDSLGVPVTDSEFSRDRLAEEFASGSADSFLAACDETIRWHVERQLAKRGE